MSIWYCLIYFFHSFIFPVSLSSKLSLEMFCKGQKLLFHAAKLTCGLFPATLNFTWIVSYSLITTGFTFLIHIEHHIFRNKYHSIAAILPQNKFTNMLQADCIKASTTSFPILDGFYYLYYILLLANPALLFQNPLKAAFFLGKTIPLYV